MTVLWNLVEFHVSQYLIEATTNSRRQNYCIIVVLRTMSLILKVHLSLIGQEDDETATAQSLPLPRDVFKIRQIRKARGGTTSQTGSASYGSAFSGELSGSTG